jgi:hypothetical protein
LTIDRGVVHWPAVCGQPAPGPDGLGRAAFRAAIRELQ